MKKGKSGGFFCWGNGNKGNSCSKVGGDTVYCLGFLGAVIYYWQTSPMLSEKLFGIIKALLWPAFLVYQVLEKLAV